jgi:hypothetical protein
MSVNMIVAKTLSGTYNASSPATKRSTSSTASSERKIPKWSSPETRIAREEEICAATFSASFAIGER